MNTSLLAGFEYLPRRDFLKILGISATALAINPLSFVKEDNEYAHFNPKLEYGMDYVTTDYIDRKALIHYINALDDVIAKVIPLEYRKKIMWIVHNPKPTYQDPLARRGAIAWKYTPKPIREKFIFI